MTKLYGLVLVGGKSTRMGKDKASMVYGEDPQWKRCYNLLGKFCERVFLSKRADQKIVENSIQDKYETGGPLNGILSAMDTHPEVAWLVLACDMPFVDEEAISYLVQSRKGNATCFFKKGRPEPVCAIYEPQLREELLKCLIAGRGPVGALADATRVEPKPEWILDINKI